MPQETSRRGMYTDDKMARQLRKGNIAEALFRLWAEDHAELFGGLEVVHQGYNPAGIVDVNDKRDLLLAASDPDFAIADLAKGRKYLLGVSINSQKAGYTCHSSMGGMCIPCPRAKSCFEGNESNLWYNRYNITNDYKQFRDRMGGIDVALVTLLISSTDTVFKWIQEEKLEQTLLDFLHVGSAGVADLNSKEKLLTYLRFGGRRGSRTRRKLSLVWLTHSELHEGRTQLWVTGGISQFGRPREVCCVDMNKARSEVQFEQLISNLRRR